MRRKILICLFCIGVVLLIFKLAWHPAFTESFSPDGLYKVEIQARSGFELLNAPEYLTITIKKLSSFQKLTIYTQIDNDDKPIDKEHNMHIFWETNKLTIILLGCEQLPEIITVSLEKGFPYEQHQYDIPRDVSDAILKKYGIL